MLWWQAFGWAVFGGVLAEFVGYYSLRHQRPNDYAHWLKLMSYWFLTCGMILGGGGIAVAYLQSGINLNAIIAMQVGATAPLFIRRLRDTQPDLQDRPDPNKVN